jgi:hypothetical protein
VNDTALKSLWLFFFKSTKVLCAWHLKFSLWTC